MALKFDPAKLEAAKSKMPAQPQPQDDQTPPAPSSFRDRLAAAMQDTGSDLKKALTKPTGVMTLGQDLAHMVTDPLGKAVEGTFSQEYPEHPMAAKIAGGFVKNAPEIMAAVAAPPVGEAADVAFAPTINEGKAALAAAEGKAGVTVGTFGADELPLETKDAIDLTDQMGHIAKMSPKDIASAMEPEGINKLRKILEYTLDNFSGKLPGTNLASASRAKQVLTQALDMAKPVLAEPRAALANSYTRSELMSKLIPFVKSAAKKAAITSGL